MIAAGSVVEENVADGALWQDFAGGFALLTSVILTSAKADTDERRLRFYHLHTNEHLDVVYKRNGSYVPDALDKINYVLRDWRRNQVISIDPKLLDVVWDAYQASGSRTEINVICGYRAPATNQMLRRRSNGVAENSQHMRGKALDFTLPDVPLAKLREIGLRIQTGGVGYYPSSGSPFVHLDTGSVRMWPRMSRDQLARVFPDGKTIYVPDDGRPLPGYEAAMAEYKSRGAVTSVASLGETGGSRNLFAAIFAPRNRDQPAINPPPTPVARTVVALNQAGPADLRPPRDRGPTAASFAFADGPADMPREADRRRFAGAVANTAESDAAAPVPRPAPAELRQALLAKAAAEAARTEPAPVPRAAPPDLREALLARAAQAGNRVDAIGAAITTANAPSADPGQGGADQAPAMAYAPPSAPVPSDGKDPLRMMRGEVPVPASNPNRVVVLSASAGGKTLTAALAGPASAPLTGPTPSAAALGGAALSPAARPAALLAVDPMARLNLRRGAAPVGLLAKATSVRLSAFALLTLPDPERMPGVLSPPARAVASGFRATANGGLRTDRFDGSVLARIEVVELAVPVPFTTLAAR